MPKGSFSQIVRYTNRYQKFIQSHIGGITGLVLDGVYGLFIELDLTLSGFLLLMMRISSSGGDVVLENDM